MVTQQTFTAITFYLNVVGVFFFNLKALLWILSRQQDGGEEFTVNMVIGLFSPLSSSSF